MESTGDAVRPNEIPTGSFDIDVTNSGKTGTGTFSYFDSSTGTSFTATRINSVTFTGNSAHIVAQGRMESTSSMTQAGGRITATIDATDNGTPGTLDTFSITLSTGYTAGGNLLSGNITVE